jgi:hypothetical protein
VEALVVIAVLGLIGGGASVYQQRKRDAEDYEQHMADRISFDCQELTAKKIVTNCSELNSND